MYTYTYDASGEKWATRTIAFPALGWALATVGTARTQAAMAAAARAATRERGTTSAPRPRPSPPWAGPGRRSARPGHRRRWRGRPGRRSGNVARALLPAEPVRRLPAVPIRRGGSRSLSPHVRPDRPPGRPVAP